MDREKEFLENLAEAYKTYDASVVENYLAEDMHYASLWVLQELTSKAEYMDYLRDKLLSMQRSYRTMEFQIVKGNIHKWALVIVNQPTPDGGSGCFVADLDDAGKVKMLNITRYDFS